MKYVYRNLKHVKLHGIEPYGIGEFDHPIQGGGIELVESKSGSKPKKSKSKKNKEEQIEEDKSETVDDSLILNETNEGDI